MGPGTRGPLVLSKASWGCRWMKVRTLGESERQTPRRGGTITRGSSVRRWSTPVEVETSDREIWCNNEGLEEHLCERRYLRDRESCLVIQDKYRRGRSIIGAGRQFRSAPRLYSKMLVLGCCDIENLGSGSRTWKWWVAEILNHASHLVEYKSRNNLKTCSFSAWQLFMKWFDRHYTEYNQVLGRIPTARQAGFHMYSAKKKGEINFVPREPVLRILARNSPMITNVEDGTCDWLRNPTHTNKGYID